MPYLRIRVRGELDAHWADWLGDLTLTHTADGDTLLEGRVPDQPALYGILSRIHSLGAEVVELVERGPEQPAGSGNTDEGTGTERSEAE